MIIDSLKKTISIMREKKLLLLVIVLLQILFFFGLGFVSYINIIPAMAHASRAIEYFEKVGKDIGKNESQGMFGYLGDNPMIVYDNYRKMIGYLRNMGVWFLVLFLFIDGFIWTLSNRVVRKRTIIKKRLKGFVISFLRLFLLGLILAFIVYVTFLELYRSLWSGAGFASIGYLSITGIFILFIFYFFLIGFCLIDRRFKEILRLMFLIGFYRFPYVLLVYLINLVVVIGSGILLYFSIEKRIFVIIACIIVFVFSFVFTRLFLIVVINSLARNLIRSRRH